MKTKYRLAAVLLGLILTLSACSTGGSTVSVERVDMLLTASQAADRYAGVVVTDNPTKITRDSSKTISELLVQEGDTVTAGQILFRYDSEALQLDLDRLKLDLERLNSQSTQYQDALKELKTQLTKAEKAKDEKLISELKIAIASKEVDVLTANYEVKTKKKEIEHIQQMLGNVNITSPIDGRVRKIDEAGEAYITIQQSGVFSVKGTLNELNMNAGIMEGLPVRIYSRLDDTRTWTGYVSTIDMENTQDNASDGYYYGVYDPMSSTSSYSFYIDLDDAEGLMLGQHVYIECGAETAQLTGVWIPTGYLMDLNTDDEADELTATVWAVNTENKLEKRTVKVGMFDDATNTYEILDGLSASDYLANPSDSGCAEGADVRFRSSEDFAVEPNNTDPAQDTPMMPGDIVLPGDVSSDDSDDTLDEADAQFAVSSAEAGGQG